ncbi:MAG: hypothetical protein GYA41_04380 [Bacteroidales bacterium]|nr:hypothetical protein [Bacteroidales bacterium]
MRKSVFFILSLILNVHLVYSLSPADTSSTGNLDLRIRNINFVRNNEYSNPIIEGYTLIGYFIQPEIVYSPSDKLKLSLGAHLLNYSGTNRFHLVKPVFSTSIRITENMFFTMGSLSGSDEHRMFDPHFNKERLYNAFPEDGLELGFLNDNFFNDLWLSWENFIFKGDNEREIFTAGESFSYRSEKIGDLVRLKIPVQVQFKHYGGQISNYPERVETWLNIAAGAGLNYDISDKKYGETGIEALFFYGKSITDNALSGIGNGSAAWYRIYYAYKNMGIHAGLWLSDDFFAPNGNYIFSSVSDHRYNYVIHERKLITCSANLKIFHKSSLEFYFEFEGFYDPDLKRFDNAASLHLRFDKLIRIAKLNGHR